MSPQPIKRVTDSDGYVEPKGFDKLSEHLDQELILTNVGQRGRAPRSFYTLSCYDPDTGEKYIFASSHVLMENTWENLYQHPEDLPVAVSFYQEGQTIRMK